MVEYAIKLKDGFLNMYQKDIFEYYTLGGIAKNVLIEKTGLCPFKISNQFYKKLINAQYAGISYSTNKRKMRNEMIRVVNIVSHYPAVMLNFEYPIPSKTKVVDNFIKGKIGIVTVNNISQKDLKSINLIPIRKEEGYDYNDKETLIEEADLTSADYENLIRYGGTCDVVKFEYWEESIQGHELFKEYIIPAAREKTIQDLIKENMVDRLNELGMNEAVNAGYDDAKRDTSKLMLNISSGKLSEKYRTENYQIATTYYEYNKLTQNPNSIEKTKLSDKAAVFCNVKNIEDEKCIKTFIPIAVFIYSYARMLIHDLLQRFEIQPFIIETDKITMSDEEYQKIINADIKKSYFNVMTRDFEERPLIYDAKQETKEKIFGLYELEGTFNRGISLSKKTYFLENTITGDKKFKYKGISKKSKIVPKDLVEKFIMSNKTNTALLINELMIRDNELESPFTFDIYERLLNGEHIYVFYSNFSKIVHLLRKRNCKFV
jgi:hypothetical protein